VVHVVDRLLPGPAMEWMPVSTTSRRRARSRRRAANCCRVGVEAASSPPLGVEPNPRRRPRCRSSGEGEVAQLLTPRDLQMWPGTASWSRASS